MHILFLSYSYWPPDFGGELLHCLERLDSMVQRGHQVTVLTSGKPGYQRNEVLSSSHVILRSSMIGSSRIARLFRRINFFIWVLFQLLFKQYDVVHFGSLPGINSLSNAFCGWLLNCLINLRGAHGVYVLSLADREDGSLSFTGVSGRLRKHWLKSVWRIVSVSPALQKAAETELGQGGNFIPYGIRDDVFVSLEQEARAQFRSELGFQPSEVVFTFLGSVDRRKGFDLLAEAFANLSESFPSWRLLVIGPRTVQENQNLDQVQTAQVISAVANNPRVIFIGRVNDRQRLAQLLGLSDVFVFPSRREGMGLAPMEAMATGVPAIIARLEGITDQVNIEGQTGLYIPPDDVSALKEAMLKLGCDDVLRSRLGAAARECVVSRFGWQRHIDKWESLYANSVNNES